MAKLRDTLHLPVCWLRPSRWQYRRRFYDDTMLELAQSIKAQGQITAVMAFPTRLEDSPDQPPEYELIAGERRVRAIFALAMAETKNWDGLPARKRLEAAVELVCQPDWWDYISGHSQLSLLDRTVRAEVWAGEPEEFIEKVVLENLQREDPDPLEEAHGYHLLLQEQGYSQRDLARKLGISQAHISQRLGLLDLSSEVQKAVSTRVITPSMARALTPMKEDDKLQSAMLSYIETGDDKGPVTVRKVEKVAKQVASLDDHFFDLDDPDAEEAAFWPPDDRNRLLLSKWAFDRIAPEDEDRGRIMVKLAEQGLLKKPARQWAGNHYHVERWLTACLRRYSSPASGWNMAAESLGRTCATCALQELTSPPNVGYGCGGKSHEWMEVASCLYYVGPDEPVLISLKPDARGFCPDPIQKDYETFCQCGVEGFLEHWQEAEEREQRREEEGESTVHQLIRQIASDYYAGQQELPNAFPDVDFDHLAWINQSCSRCVYFVHGQEPGEQCRYAQEPEKSSTGIWHVPATYQLVRESDGVVVGQCARFRWRMDALDELPEASMDADSTIWVWCWFMGQSWIPRDWLTWVEEPPERGESESWLQNQDNLSSAQMWTLLIIDINRHILSDRKAYAAYGQRTAPVLNPLTGGTEVWSVAEWPRSEDHTRLLEKLRGL